MNTKASTKNYHASGGHVHKTHTVAQCEHHYTAFDWCNTILDEFKVNHLYTGLNKLTQAREETKTVNWFIAEVQALYLRHEDMFARSLRDTLTLLYALDLKHIMQPNNYWPYLVGEVIFKTQPLGFYIGHKDDAWDEQEPEQ